MKMVAVEIISFRSIVDQSLEFKNNTIGLVGLNESGKSNVLTAIRTLDNDYKLKESDRSKINEQDPKIVFRFHLEGKEATTLADMVEKFVSENCKVIVTDLFKKPAEIIDINIIRTRTLDSKKNVVSFSGFSVKGELNNGFLISPSITGKEGVPVTFKDGVSLPLNKARIVREAEIEKESVTAGGYAALTSHNFKSLINYEIIKCLNTFYPEVRYWQYDAKYLIPSEVRYDEFVKDDGPREFSVPLYNIFFIAKELKLGSEGDLLKLIEVWKKDSGKRRKDTEIINNAVNKYIKSIWQDYDQELCIVLEENKITVHVKDPSSPIKNYYEMIERSQGFKTFISFILTISADVDSEFLQNYILILDEPETHLHPSGVRFMRNEIFKLSQRGNKVIFATHSIFMVDRQDLGRYVIVSKNFESTRLCPVKRDTITQESVIYEALGTTIDEFAIKPWNIMFEGELDKAIFKFYIKFCLKKNAWLEAFELLDGGGTKAMHSFFKDKVLPKSTFWILVVDNDKPAQTLIENMKRIPVFDYKKQCLCLRYSDMQDEELEDILPLDIVSSAFNVAIKSIGLNETDGMCFADCRPISSQSSEFMARKGLVDVDKKRLEEQFKIGLHKLVSDKLKVIQENNTTIPARMAAFIAEFPNYHRFIDKAVGEIMKLK